MGFLKVRSLPPEWAGYDIGFAVGIDVSNRSTFGEVLVAKLDSLEEDSRFRSFTGNKGGDESEEEIGDGLHK